MTAVFEVKVRTCWDMSLTQGHVKVVQMVQEGTLLRSEREITS